MECRLNCGACCIATSITSPLPGLPKGKPAGMRCIHLDDDSFCDIYEKRPDVCKRLFPQVKYCGKSREEALRIITRMEERFQVRGDGLHSSEKGNNIAAQRFF